MSTTLAEEYERLITHFLKAAEAASIGGVAENKQRMRDAIRVVFEFERTHELLLLRDVCAKQGKAEARLEKARIQLRHLAGRQAGRENLFANEFGTDADTESLGIEIVAFERLQALGAKLLPALENAVEELRNAREALLKRHPGALASLADPIARERGDFSHIEREVYAGK